MRTENDGRLVLLVDRHEIRWVSGFSGSAARVLVDAGARTGWCVVDSRYLERAIDEIGAHGEPIEVLPARSGESLDDAVVRIAGARPVEVDPETVTVGQHQRLGSRINLETAASVVADLRRVKDEWEIERIAAAARIADQALQAVLSDGLCGLTERQVRDRLDAEMRRLGADDVSFPTIVAGGPNGAIPHHCPGERVIGSGDLVVIDMGAEVDGYRSDMTRTVRVGEVSHQLERMLATVLEAQSRASSATEAGVVGRVVDAAARSHFESEGVGDEYLHSTGHGVGLEIHESPIIGPRCEATLREGEVVTVEPGLYRVGVGGARIEDLVVVGVGCVRPLTLTPKDLSCPPSPRMI